MNLRDEILRRLDALPIDMQRQVLAYVDSFHPQSVRGDVGSRLLPLAGTLDETSASEMREAIEAECECVDLREW